MSKYTTEVRYVCQTYANITSGTTLTIDETILAAIPYIFTDDWTTQDTDHKEELCKKILRHYYMREIGAETVGLWKLQLNSLLAEIMPKYNVLYSNLENIKAKLLLNADMTETRNLTNTQTTKADSSSTSNSTGSSATNATGSSTSTTTGSSDNNSSATSNNDAWQEYSDTPQGALTGIQDQTYLTNATRNRSTNTNESTSKTTATNDGSTTTKDDTMVSTKDDSTTTGTSSGNSDTTENYTLTITGKNSGSSYIDEYLKIQAGYNDIDQMIIKDLAPCFIALWE